MSEDKIIDFKSRAGIGDGIHLNPNDVLCQARDQYAKLVLVGETEYGEIRICGTDGAPESLMLLQWASAYLVKNRVAP